MIGPWERLEGSSHDDELDAGVEARVADPLWMLARQWQTGEFRGDDAGSPISAKVGWTARPVVSFQPGVGGPILPIGEARPLERTVEAAPPPVSGSAALHWASRLAGQLVRRLARRGRQDAIDALQTSFSISAADTVALPGAGSQAVELLRNRGIDGAEVLALDDAATAKVFGALPAAAQNEALAIVTSWREETNARFEVPEIDTWDEHRLEHSFSLAAGSGDDEVVLSARQYVGGHLDWYSFDVEPNAKHGLPSAKEDGKPVTAEVTAIPTPVSYSGMPATRWWEFEEGNVHFGDIEAEAGDLAKLLLADYATVYGNDWFSVPVRLPLGTVTQVDRVEVYDTMGAFIEIDPAGTVDTRSPGERAFRLYELTGDPSLSGGDEGDGGDEGKSPLLFLPPSLSGSDTGPVLEKVELIRDEASNLAWAIERYVEGPTGRTVDRLQHWRMTQPVPPGSGVEGEPGSQEPDLEAGETETEEAWRYRLESSAPPFWIPFVPTRFGNRGQVRLRRARMQEWELAPDSRLVGLKGELLQPGQMMTIEEEEVPRGGVTLERRWQTARWTDGSLHVWRQRSKRLGYGERSSGVRWDLLE